jgi:hypothetical protein
LVIIEYVMKHIVEVMIPEAEVAARIATLGEEITARYQGSEEVVMIGCCAALRLPGGSLPSVPVAHHPGLYDRQPWLRHAQHP